MRLNNWINATLLSLVLQTSLGSVAEDASATATATAAPTINTPILTPLENPVARAIVEKHLPNLVKALDEDYDAADFLGDSSLKELSIDDNHVIGFDEDLLLTLERELNGAAAG